MRKYRNIESINKAIEKKENSLKRERDRTTSSFSRIGFGHSMRCTKINISFSKEDKLKSDLRELYMQKEEMIKCKN